MENKNNKEIRIKIDEEIISIVNKLKQCEKDEITLLVPSKALLLQNVVNLKILKRKAGELRKNISIIATNENNELAKDADTENRVEEKKKVKMFDIVKKVNKADDKIKEETSAENITKNELSEEQLSEQSDIRINRDEFVDTPKSQESVISSSKKTKKRTILLPSISSKVFAVFIFSCLATTALIAFFIFQKVDITIALKAQEKDYNFEFVTDESINEIDEIYNKIPVEKIEVVSEKTETYSTTGKKRVTEKAGGEITVYNEFSSTNPQRIMATTRFLSKEGHIFRIKDSIIIPVFSRVEGKDVPGEVTVTVYADEPGEKYNIGPSSFTVPALQGHPKYSGIYARSTQAMSGGIDKDVLYFSESDYITAKDKLVKIAEEESEQDFLSKISDQVILLENTKERSDTEIKTDIKIGATADDFEMTVLVKTNALFVNKNNLDNLISAKINSELGENKELVKGSENYEIKEIVKNENGSVAMSVYATQDLITKVDADKIREEIAGKSESELNNYFNNVREIESVNIEFWPDWVKSVPASWDKINIEFEK